MPQRPPGEASADLQWERDTPPPDSRGAKWTLGTSGGKGVTGATNQKGVATTATGDSQSTGGSSDDGPTPPDGGSKRHHDWAHRPAPMSSTDTTANSPKRQARS